MTTMGQRIRERRESLGLTQVVLAERVGIKQHSLSKIETGATEMMAAATLVGICRELRLTAEYVVLGGNGADPELALQEAETIYILRALAPEQRASMLSMARSLYEPPPSVLPARTMRLLDHKKTPH